MELLMISLMVVPLVFAGVIAFRPAGVSRVWALGGTGLTLLLAAALLGQFLATLSAVPGLLLGNFELNLVQFTTIGSCSTLSPKP